MKTSFLSNLLLRFAALAFIFAAFLFLSRGQEGVSPPPAQEQIHETVGRILKNADKANCKRRQCAILVTDFTFSSGLTSHVGMQLADQFLKELTSQQPETQLINRSALRAYLDQQRIPGVLLKDQTAIRWLGKQLGGTAVLRGLVEDKGSSLTIKIQLLSCDKEKAHIEEELTLPSSGLTDGLTPVEGFHQNPPRVPEPIESTIFRAGVGGVTQPRCVYCPNPDATKEVRGASFSGSVVMDVLVSAEGRATQVTILRGVPFGMNEAAIGAVHGWKFKPATLNGKTVPVKVMVEIVVRFL